MVFHTLHSTQHFTFSANDTMSAGGSSRIFLRRVSMQHVLPRALETPAVVKVQQGLLTSLSEHGSNGNGFMIIGKISIVFEALQRLCLSTRSEALLKQSFLGANLTLFRPHSFTLRKGLLIMPEMDAVVAQQISLHFSKGL